MRREYSFSMRRNWFGLSPCVLPCTLLIFQTLRKNKADPRAANPGAAHTSARLNYVSGRRLEVEGSERCGSDASV